MLNAVIKPILEEKEFGYYVKRADQDADPGMIGDRVVTDVIQADLIVADLTDLNPNALYELGIRHSTEKPTIHIAKSGTKLPFDNAGHRTIFVDLADWHSIEAARKKLAESARAVDQPDYNVSNPITQANASFRMQNSGDSNEQVIIQMNERLHRIENAIRQPFAERKPDFDIRWRAEMDRALEACDKTKASADYTTQVLMRIADSYDLKMSKENGRLMFLSPTGVVAIYENNKII